MYPFRIVISRRADRISMPDLPSEAQVLLGDSPDLPETQGIFQFSVLAEYTPQASGSKRQRNRRRYSNTDRVVITASSPSVRIQFLSAYPSTTLTTGESLSNLQLPILSNHKPQGRAKDLFRRKGYQVVTSCTPDVVQWVFGKRYVEALVDRTFVLTLRLIVPQSLEAEQRYLYCSVTFSQKGRTLEQARSRKVELPSL
jgi:hypothetical protein